MSYMDASWGFGIGYENAYLNHFLHDWYDSLIPDSEWPALCAKILQVAVAEKSAHPEIWQLKVSAHESFSCWLLV